jgi:hypothetical protein
MPSPASSGRSVKVNATPLPSGSRRRLRHTQMAMACDVTPFRPARWSARAILALAVLAGLVVMHGLGSSLESMAVMSSSHSSTTTTT